MDQRTSTELEQAKKPGTPDMIITLVGDSGVGKSQILQRLTENTFSETTKATQGILYADKEITLEGGVGGHTLRCYDMAGQERFAPLSIPQEVRSSDGAVVVVLDGTKPKKELHESMTKWVDWAETNSPKATIYFMVNKMDEKGFRGIFYLHGDILEWNSGRKKSKQNHQNIWPFYCSAKTGNSTLNNAMVTQRVDGIEKAFSSIATECSVKRAIAEQIARSGGGLKNTNLPASEPSEDGSVWGDFKNFVSDNPVLLGVDAFLIMALITLLVVATFPVGAVFALGPLSALAAVGIIGGGALLVWNLGYAIFKGLGGGGGEPQSIVSDGSTPSIRFSVVNTLTNTPATPGHQQGVIFQPETQQPQTPTPQPPISNTNQTTSTSPKPGSGPKPGDNV